MTKSSSILILLFFCFIGIGNQGLAQITDTELQAFFGEIKKIRKKRNFDLAQKKFQQYLSANFDKMTCGQKGFFFKENGIVFQLEGSYQEASAKYEEAINAFESCDDKNEFEYLKTLYNFARSFEDQLKNDQAEDQYHKFFIVATGKDLPNNWMYKKHLGYANFLTKIQNISLSKFHIEKAKSLVNRFELKDKAKKDKAFKDIYRTESKIYLRAENYDKAITSLEKYFNLVKKSGVSSLSTFAAAKLNLANAYEKKFEFDKMEIVVDEMKIFYETYPTVIGKENFENIENLLLIGKENYKEAINKYSNQIASLKEDKASNEIPLIAAYENLGSAYQFSKNYDKARINFDSSLELLLKDQGQNIEGLLAENMIYDVEQICNTLNSKAETYLEEHNETGKINLLDTAADQFKNIELIYNKKNKSLLDDYSKLELLDNVKPIFEEATKTFLKLDKHKPGVHLAEAYRFASLIKGKVLQEGSKANTAIHTSLPDSIFKMERSLSENLVTLENKISITNNLVQKDSLLNKYLETEKKHTDFISELEKTNPEYYRLKYEEINPLSLKEVQHSINKNALVLDYYFTPDTIICFSISSEKIAITQSAIDSSLKQQLDNFRLNIEQGKSISKEENDALYQTLIAKNIAQHSEKEYLIIIPDEDLLKIPFESLETDDKFLIQKYAVSYLFMNNQLIKTKQKHVAKSFAGFGTRYSKNINEGLDKKIDPKNLPLLQLPQSTTEIRNANVFWEGDTFLDNAATKENFLSVAQNYNILQIAIHGILNNESPDQSSLIFDDSEEDNVLNANELYLLNLNNQLTILTACNSGNGKIYKGEGIRSIARGFAFAGCPSIVSSMWSASDASTNDISTSFNKYLNEGLDKSKALQLAKIDYLENALPTQRQPQLWSHLILIGNTDPIKMQSWNWSYVFIGLLALFLIGFLLKAKGR